MIVSLVAAVSRNGVIGRGGGVPWHLPADLRRFRKLTWGHHVVMGRRTFESLPGPLPGRTNIVLTRRRDYRPAGCETAHSLEEALRLGRDRGEEETFVLGGGEIFRVAIPLADRIHLTRVLADLEGDTTFPEIDPAVWREVQAEDRPADDRNPIAVRFLRYDRV